MHVSGIPLDLSSLLQFVFTALALAVGLIHLVKITASRYLVVDAKFEEKTAEGVSPVTSGQMLSGGVGDSCFVCGSSASKKCSGCKAVRYCSQICQSKHWRAEHRLKCKEFQLDSGSGRRKASGWMDNFSSGPSLVPARGNCRELQQPKKILFPYDEFVKLFNWNSPGFPPCGLLNCGNSCFANVVLQCLACTRPLVAYLLERGHSRECTRNDWCFLCELQSHVHKASLSLLPFSPINILSRLPNIGGNLGYGKQEDAHEFMRLAVDTMQSVCLDEFGGEKVLDPSTQETTLIQHIFGGHLRSQVMCTKCQKISYRYENMMDLTVEIQGDAASLEDCLEQFTAKEWLDGENMYKCDGCNDYVKAWKRLTVHKPPNILTITLKRFQSGRFGKLNKRVTFPETLDLGQYMSETGNGTDLYRLYAVVVHVDMLNASFFGHYICYTKDFQGNWYGIDDCKVMKVELEEVLSQGAYMLLYSRICARQARVLPLESVAELVPQSGAMAQESTCSLMESVESGITESASSVTSAESLSSDISVQSIDSSCERELPIKMDHKDMGENPEEMDLVYPVDVNSETMMENSEYSGSGLSESSSSGSVGAEGGRSRHHSLAMVDAPSIEVVCKEPTALVLPTPPSTSGDDMVEQQEPCTTSRLHCISKEESGARNIYVKEFQVPEYSSDNVLAAKPSPTSIDSLNSESKSLHEINVACPYPSDSRSEQVVVTGDPSVSRSGIMGSDKLFSAAESTELKIPIHRGVSNSRKGKPWLTPAFIDKPVRKKTPNEAEKVRREHMEIGPSSKVTTKRSGFLKAVFTHPSASSLDDDNPSLKTFGGDILDCEKLPMSPDSLDDSIMTKYLNEYSTTKEEHVVLDSPYSTGRSGYTYLNCPDQNGSMASRHDGRLHMSCGNKSDPLPNEKPVFTTWAEPMSKVGEADLLEVALPSGKVKPNENGFVDCQNGTEIQEYDQSSVMLAENGKDVSDCGNTLISRGFPDRSSRRNFNASEVVEKELGADINSITQNNSCNGFTNSDSFADGSIYTHDTGLVSLLRNDKDEHLICKRPRQEVDMVLDLVID